MKRCVLLGIYINRSKHSYQQDKKLSQAGGGLVVYRWLRVQL